MDLFASLSRTTNLRLGQSEATESQATILANAGLASFKFSFCTGMLMLLLGSLTHEDPLTQHGRLLIEQQLVDLTLPFPWSLSV